MQSRHDKMERESCLINFPEELNKIYKVYKIKNPNTTKEEFLKKYKNEIGEKEFIKELNKVQRNYENENN